MPEVAPTTILVTRPEPGATETAARLTAMGLRPVVAPLLAIAARGNKLPPPAGFAAVLVTSGNALPPLAPAWCGCKLFAVGDRTAARARQAGFTDVASADGDAATLAALVSERLTPAQGMLLLASGQGQGQGLAATLRGAGFRVLRRVVYAALPVPALPAPAAATLVGGEPVVAMFFSAATARHFVRLVVAAGLEGKIRDSEAVGIGPATGVALRALPWRRIRVAARPNQDEMLALLQ